MKINVFEAICDEFGGYYERYNSSDNELLFVTLNTCVHALFPDDLNRILRKTKKQGFRLQYISYKNDGIGLEFVK